MFETDRLILRGYHKSDMPDIFALLSTYPVQIAGFTSYVRPLGESFREKLEKSFEAAILFIVATEKTTGGYVGHAGIHTKQEPSRDGEVSIAIVEDCWGRGYGTEIRTWLIDWGFCGLNLHRLSLTVFEHNLPAIGLYKKVGFVQEGVIRKSHWLASEGKWVDTILIGILEDEFWEKNGPKK